MPDLAFFLRLLSNPLWQIANAADFELLKEGGRAASCLLAIRLFELDYSLSRSTISRGEILKAKDGNGVSGSGPWLRDSKEIRINAKRELDVNATLKCSPVLPHRNRSRSTLEASATWTGHFKATFYGEPG